MLKQLDLRGKFLAVGVVLVLPLLWVSYLLLSQMNIAINFSAKEQVGSLYLRPLQPILDEQGAARHAVHLGAPPNLAGLKSSWQNLASLQADYGLALGTESAYRAAQSAIEQLAQAPTSVNADALLSATRALIAKAGDASNLILDPDLDTYYIMDTVLLKLPDSLDLLWQIQQRGQAILTRGSISADEKTAMVVLSGLLQASVDGVNYDAKVAYENNPAGDLPADVQQRVVAYSQAVGQLQALLQRDFSGSALPAPPNNFVALTSQVRAANLELYGVASQALENMLKRRVSGFATEKWLTLFGLLGAELLAIALAVLLLRGVLRQLGGSPAMCAIACKRLPSVTSITSCTPRASIRTACWPASRICSSACGY